MIQYLTWGIHITICYKPTFCTQVWWELWALLNFSLSRVFTACHLVESEPETFQRNISFCSHDNISQRPFPAPTIISHPQHAELPWVPGTTFLESYRLFGRRPRTSKKKHFMGLEGSTRVSLKDKSEILRHVGKQSLGEAGWRPRDVLGRWRWQRRQHDV